MARKPEAEQTSWQRAYSQRIDSTKERPLPNDDDTRAKHPNVWEMLTTFALGEKYVTEGAVITISVGLGCYTVRISHPDTGMSKTTGCATFAEALAALERALVNPDIPWLVWRGKEPTLRKRRKEGD